MDTKLLLVFIGLNIANVIIQTVKSIATVKCGKGVAAIVNAVAYGLCELSLGLKALIVALCNLIGVYVVKWCEEKARKDKLWKIEATVFEPYTKSLHLDLTAEEIPCNYIPKIGKWSVFNIYCDTQEKSKKVKVLLDKYEAKYFVSETKTL